MFGDFFSSLSK